MATSASRSPNGFNNAPMGSAMANASHPDPSVTHLFWDDFDHYTAAQWSVTNVGVTPTNALTAENGGVLLNTTTAGATDATYLQKPTAGFQIILGKQAMFKARIKLSDASLSDVYAGMLPISATPLAATEGLFMFKTSGQTGWVLRSIVGGVTTDTPVPASLVAANATYLEVAFRVNTNGSVAVYINSLIGTGNFDPAVNSRGRIAMKATGPLTAALLSPSFGIRNGAAAVKTLSVDYVLASFER